MSVSLSTAILKVYKFVKVNCEVKIGFWVGEINFTPSEVSI